MPNTHDCLLQGPPEQRRLHWTFLLLPAGVAAFLGTWQVGRQQWKVEQVQQREAGLKACTHTSTMSLRMTQVPVTFLSILQGLPPCAFLHTVAEPKTKGKKASLLGLHARHSQSVTVQACWRFCRRYLHRCTDE